MSKPLAVDLFCGRGGWTHGLIAEGWRVIGFDIEARPQYPAQLVLQDVLTLHGSQFRDADLIVASPPCQAYSYMAMPFSHGKRKAAEILADTTGEKMRQLNTLFDACFRIQREACDAAGRYIPLIIENVKGAQRWVGRAKWHYGSFYLWGDVPALMPTTVAVSKNDGGSWFSASHNQKPHQNPRDGVKVQHHLNGEVPKGVGKTSWFHGNTKHELRDGVKAPDGSYGVRGWFGQHGGTGVERSASGDYGIKQGGTWWHDPASKTRRFNSRSKARKEASAIIAEIPPPLARHIGRVFYPETKHERTA